MVRRLFVLVFAALWLVVAWKVAGESVREFGMVVVLAHGYALAWRAFSRGFRKGMKREDSSDE